MGEIQYNNTRDDYFRGALVLPGLEPKQVSGIPAPPTHHKFLEGIETKGSHQNTSAQKFGEKFPIFNFFITCL